MNQYEQESSPNVVPTEFVIFTRMLRIGCEKKTNASGEINKTWKLSMNKSTLSINYFKDCLPVPVQR